MKHKFNRHFTVEIGREEGFKVVTVRIFNFEISNRKSFLKKAEKKYEKDNSTEFFDYNIEGKRVLIVEPNFYHGEIIPSYIKYFKDLGYGVDVLLRVQHKADLPFIRMADDFNLFFGNLLFVKKILSLKKINKYDFVFFSSTALWDKFCTLSYLQFLKFIPKSKFGLLMVEHNVDPYVEIYKEKKYLKQKRLFSCSGFQNVPMLSPCYFGEVNVTGKNAEKTIFVSVGRIHPYVKNYDLLVETVTQLLDNGYDNFEVIVDGYGELDLSERLKKYIIIRGRTTFNTMFDDIEKSDFILYLLDDTVPQHNSYRIGKTSGTLNIQLGFTKPGILSSKFAQGYNLSDKDSIVYEKNNLYEAMVQAINMTNEEYQEKQQNISSLRAKRYNKSLDNLRQAITENSKKRLV